MKASDRAMERDPLGFFPLVTVFTRWVLTERIPLKIVSLKCRTRGNKSRCAVRDGESICQEPAKECGSIHPDLERRAGVRESRNARQWRERLSESCVGHFLRQTKFD